MHKRYDKSGSLPFLNVFLLRKNIFKLINNSKKKKKKTNRYIRIGKKTGVIVQRT